jgi:hypothetical protein
MASKKGSPPELSLASLAEAAGIEPPTLADVYGIEAAHLIENATKAMLHSRVDAATKASIEAAIQVYIQARIAVNSASADERNEAMEHLTTATKVLSSFLKPIPVVAKRYEAISKSAGLKKANQDKDAEKLRRHKFLQIMIERDEMPKRHKYATARAAYIKDGGQDFSKSTFYTDLEEIESEQPIGS